MKISYLISCHNETSTLSNLLERLDPYIRGTFNEVVVLDDFSDNPETKDILDAFVKQHPETHVKVIQHALNNDYGAHKNYGIEQCNGDYIFQLDGDELPPECLLGESLHELLESNPTIEAYAVPRINDFKGVTPEHAKKWGWKLSPSTSIIHEKIIDTNSEEYKFLQKEGYILEETAI